MLTDLTVGERTVIDSNLKIILAGSRYNIEVPTTGTSAVLCVWIWNGAQNKVLGQPTITLPKAKVSSADTYINFEISEQIKSEIEDPKLSYTYISDSNNLANSDLAVFVQYKWEDNDDVLFVSPTYLATRGKRWDYERNSFGLSRLDSPLGADGLFGATTASIKYNPAVNYYNRTFVYGTSVATATTRNLILPTLITPTITDACQRELYLVVYLNKLGLWSQFSPYGKAMVNNKITRNNYTRPYRRPKQVYNDVMFSKESNISDIIKSYVLNTDYIDQSANNVIEDIIYSDAIYLVKFEGDFQATGTYITIDSTLVTIDNTNITIDSYGNDPTKFKTFQQIPVICTNENFEPKTNINDKIKIEYNLSFESTTNKII
jgi:hypothetical protein